MKIGELSQKTGMAASAIRFYEERGLLPAATRGSNGYRHYADNTVQRLILVRSAQRMGFSLVTIRGLFSWDGECSKEKTLEEVDVRLREVAEIELSLNAQRTELLALRSALEHSMATGQAMDCEHHAVQ
ncbi:MerR family copper efflux transcriptional regulator [Actimicrobium sp. GrIS 1.19]|uniref:MerR family transcriptional regulator n=1 Tax=Actimicrobium sp. GrIS 1.19 TaxID=3071708 RepID=UPI002E005680|nr:MerR family copper efflux transcriptional regulator [Actimicrobium sp. GrIS 1.19]